MDTIDDLKAAKEEGFAEGEGSAQKKRQRKEDPGEQARMDELLTRNLNRNQAMFKKWSLELLRGLFTFVDPKSAPFSVMANISSKDRLLELVEFAFDLKVFDPKPDRASSLQMATLLPKMKDLYEQCGKRLTSISGHIADGFFDWRNIGHYSVEIVDAPAGADGSKQFNVFNKTMNKSVLVAREVTDGDDTMSEVVIKLNYSMTSAFLQTGSDCYNIAHFPP